MSTFTLENYIVNRKRIGKGSFSTIYLGKHKQTNIEYAIKEIPVDNIKKIKENIKREFNLMKNLNHKNIIKLHNVIIDNRCNNIYLVLDYYKNGDLSNFLNKRPLKEIFSQKYLIQLSEGLKYLLDNKIVHRDLKPQNILVTDTYDIKITDFGFARYFDNDIMIQTLCGSPIYMAPEIMKQRKYNNKSDLWSVGIILYEMLVGYPPYRAKNLVSLLKAIDKNKIQFPPNLSISLECSNLLLSLLVKDPDKRIGWEDFFNHPWLQTDKVLENENNLLDFSFNSSMPDLNKFNENLNQFSSFRHTSILENADCESKNLSTQQTDEYQNVTTQQTDEYQNSLGLEIQFKSNNSYESSHDESDFSDEYHSIEDEEPDVLVASFIRDNGIPKSEPINIEKKLTFDDNYFNVENPTNSYMFNSLNGFVLVNSPRHRQLSEPTRNTISSSFKDYLSNSISFLKQSYNYISSNNKSI